VHCWGQGTQGQLGYGNTNNVSSPPAAAVDVGGRVVQISASEVHTCALLEGGTVRCWGRVDFGALGYGNGLTIGDDDKPSQYGDIDVGGKVVSIDCGGNTTCAILDTGGLRCWGVGLIGRLGYGNTNDIGDDETPASVGDVPIGGKVVQVASSFTHSCALLEGGSVRCWGYGNYGMLGYGNVVSIGDDEPAAAAGDVPVGAPAVAITVGHWHSCALLSGGAVRCWGHALQAELGYGNITDIGDDETPASAGDVNIGVAATAIHAGEEHTCILTGAGAIRCWGDGSLGGLGYGNTEAIGDNEVPASAGDVPF